MRSSALVLAAIASWTPTPEAAVTVLDDANWEASVTGDALWLVKFYAPWCGHCKRLAPILDEISDEVQDVKVGKVDCTVETGLRERFKVKGYPTLILMQGGKTWEHRGKRTKAGLLALLDRMRRPAVLPLATQSDLEAARKSVLFVFVRGDGAEAGALANFEAVARSRMHADDFAATEANDVLSSFGLGDTVRPFVAKLEPGETKPDILDAKALLEMDEAALGSWVADNRLPTFSMLDRDNFWELSQNPSRPLALFMLDPCNGTACDATLGPEAATSLIGAEMRRISRDPKFRHKFYFGLLDGRTWKEFAADHHVELEHMPRLLVLKAGSPRSFFLHEGRPDDGPRHFLRRVALGEVVAEYEGWWGLPERWWRIAEHAVPALSSLHFLPRYSLVSPLLLVAALLVLRLLLWMPEAPHEKEQ